MKRALLFFETIHCVLVHRQKSSNVGCQEIPFIICLNAFSHALAHVWMKHTDCCCTCGTSVSGKKGFLVPEYKFWAYVYGQNGQWPVVSHQDLLESS